MRLGFILKIAAIMIMISTFGSVVLVLSWHQPASTILYWVFFAMIPISVHIGLVQLSETRAKAIVQKWAARHGYQIVRIESPFRSGAFSGWTTSQGQFVYFITIREASGDERKAWVRCGSFCGGVIFSEEIEVKWESSQESSNPQSG